MRDLNTSENSNHVLVMGQQVLVFQKTEEGLEEEFIRTASEELREDSIMKKDALAQLKALIMKAENIYLPLDDDEVDIYLCAYLRACKFYVNSAFERLKMQCHYRFKYPDFFANVLPATERKPYEKNLLTILPNRDQRGRRMLILQLGKKWKPSECSLIETVRSVVLSLEAAILEPRTQISGAVLIVDMEGFGYQHVWQFNAPFAKMIVNYIQEVVPMRLKAIHVVKQPYIFNVAYTIFKPFMKEKLTSRLHLHGTDETALLKYVDAKYLPSQYGGLMNVPMNMGLEQWNFLCSISDRYEKTSRYGYIGKPKKSRK